MFGSRLMMIFPTSAHSPHPLPFDWYYRRRSSESSVKWKFEDAEKLEARSSKDPEVLPLAVALLHNCIMLSYCDPRSRRWVIATRDCWVIVTQFVTKPGTWWVGVEEGRRIHIRRRSETVGRGAQVLKVWGFRVESFASFESLRVEIESYLRGWAGSWKGWGSAKVSGPSGSVNFSSERYLARRKKIILSWRQPNTYVCLYSLNTNILASASFKVSSSSQEQDEEAPPCKRPAARTSAKRPAARTSTDPDKEPPRKRPAAARKRAKNPQKKWKKMFYNLTEKAALRNNFSHGRQIMQFGQKGMSKELAYGILDECIGHLETGTLTEEQAKEWCENKLKDVD